MQRMLSFEDSPSLSGPMRFFFTAPLFALAAGLLLLWQGEAALLSRWAMPTLALTHLMTLGFLAMIMCGALLQILPVVAGVTVLHADLTAEVTFYGLAGGTVLLVAGFFLAYPFLFRIAAAVLGLTFLLLLASVCVGLGQRNDTPAAATVRAIRLALLSLGATLTLGIALAASFGWSLPLPVMRLTDLHAAWGLVGWVGLLIAGVAIQVIPMFQATPVYPRAITVVTAPLTAGLLAAWSLGAIGNASSILQSLQTLSGALLAALFAAFSLTTLYLLHKRKRPAAEASTLFWRLAMVSLLGCAVLFVMPRDVAGDNGTLALGILFIVGCAMSATNGMLYKIVPFLLWYHLQSRAGLDRKAVPNIKKLLPDGAARQQFWLHCAALSLLMAAALAPQALARPAAAAFCFSTLRLWQNLLQAGFAYRRAVASPGSSVVIT